MQKVAVKLKNPDNRFEKDNGEVFTPYETHVVELSERIKKSIEIGMLEKVPGHPVDNPPAEAVPADTNVGSSSEAKPPKNTDKK